MDGVWNSLALVALVVGGLVVVVAVGVVEVI